MTDRGEPRDAEATTPLPVDVTGLPSALGAGRYRLRERLGAGGMGIVVAAHDGVLGRDVAIKLLADNLAADPEARARFEREAQAAARITHPNVVQIFDVGEESGRPYLVMELVDGPSLSTVVERRGPLPASEVEDVAVQALQGLARAHAAGLLHRDLKPGNLLRAPDGTVKVTDFGVAQATELPQMTRTGLVLGTLPYLAPERLHGAPASVSTDLYGLGATLLELLTGSTRAAGGDVAGELDTVPPRLAGVIQLCLARDPAQRPASARTTLDLLEGRRSLPTVPMEDAGGAEGGGAADPRAQHDATEVLTAAEATPTEAVTRAPRTVVSAPDGGPEHDARPEPPRRGPRATPWVAVLLGVTVLVIVALIGLGDEPAAGPAREGPPRGDTPAETIRELGDWIRGQVDDG